MATSEFDGSPAVDGLASFQRVSVWRQAHLRELNDRLRARHFDEREFEVFCECGRGSCRGAVHVATDVYDELRRVPTHFLMKHSHAGAEERVVVSYETFVIIEKFGPAALEAVRLEREKGRRSAAVTSVLLVGSDSDG